MKRTIFLSLLLVSMSAVAGRAQTQANIAARLGYPQLVIYNAKIVTVDDPGVNENLGRIVQALAVRDGKILAVGSNAEVRALAGPQTKQLDLGGRTVLPGLMSTHEHPSDWMVEDATLWNHALGMEDKDKKWMAHWLEPAPAAESYKKFWSTLGEMVGKAKPGEWILLNFDRSGNLAWGEDTGKFFGRGKEISKEGLDNAAPNNPVFAKSGMAWSIINSKALEEVKKAYPGFKNFTPSTGLSVADEPGGIEEFEKNPFGILKRSIPHLALGRDYRPVAQLLKASLDLWAAYGMTAVGSATYNPVNYQAAAYLDRQGEMSMRIGWGYIGPDYSEETLQTAAGLVGQGSDYLWNVGAWGTIGASCTTIDAPPEVKQQERCNFAPGSPGREILNRIIRTGGRIATMHTDGDKDIGYYLDAIEEESAKAGFTLDEIRARRHTFDHMDGSPSPAQIPRVKKLGMVLSGQNWYLLADGAITGSHGYATAYGEKYSCWVVPRKSVFDAGIMASWEVDRPVPWQIWQRVYDGMTRYNERDQKVYCPEERTSRIVQLKAMTTWGSYYLLRENQLGSLEPGKLADFIVLDRDFLTIPEKDIPNVHVLMTVVGGKTVSLLPSLSQELNMQPAGAVTWKEIDKPFLVEEARKLTGM